MSPKPCAVAGCGEPRAVTASGKPYTRCPAHLRAQRVGGAGGVCIEPGCGAERAVSRSGIGYARCVEHRREQRGHTGPTYWADSLAALVGEAPVSRRRPPEPERPASIDPELEERVLADVARAMWSRRCEECGAPSTTGRRIRAGRWEGVVCVDCRRSYRAAGIEYERMDRDTDAEAEEEAEGAA